MSDRNYEEYSVINSSTLNDKNIPDINPIEHKLFNQDIFNYDESTKTFQLEQKQLYLYIFMEDLQICQTLI